LATDPPVEPADGAHHSGYDPSTTEVILGETAALLRALGLTSHHTVLIGGMVPNLLVLDPPGPAHLGTTDIDLCLSIALIDGDTAEYDRIETCLRSAGFQPTKKSFRWRQSSGLRLVVEFFCPTTDQCPAGRLYRPRQVENPTAKHNMGGNLTAVALDAGELLSTDTVTVSREVILPNDGGRMSYEFTVCGLLGFLAAKTAALHKRDKPKDAYDIVWITESWPDGPRGAAAAITASPQYGHQDVPQILDSLYDAFSAVDKVGPASYARFLADPQDTPADRIRLARRATGAINELRRHLQGS